MYSCGHYKIHKALFFFSYLSTWNVKGWYKNPFFDNLKYDAGCAYKIFSKNVYIRFVENGKKRHFKTILSTLFHC